MAWPSTEPVRPRKGLAPQKHIIAYDNPPTGRNLSGDYCEKARPEGRALILLHAELVDAAVGVGLTWTEEC